MPAKILVADDEQNIIKLLRLYLRNEGYEVVAAADGRQALERFSAESPDLVLLDLMMPELGGLEVCTEIRKRSDVPVIMLTARSDDVDKIVRPGGGRGTTTSSNRSTPARWSLA